MNWYTEISAERKGLPWQGLVGGGIIATPFALYMIMNATNLNQQQAKQLIEQQPEQAQQILEKAQQEVSPLKGQPQQLETSPELIHQESIENIQEEPKPITKEQNQMIGASDMLDFIAQWEGFEPIAYPDGDSKSVGYGFYLGNSFSREKIESIGGNFDRIFAGQEQITPAQARQLLQISAQIAVNDALSYYPELGQHPKAVQMIIIDMAYTMGISRLNKFNNLKAALENRDYKRAAEIIEKSRWFGQTGRRGQNHYQTMMSLSN